MARDQNVKFIKARKPFSVMLKKKIVLLLLQSFYGVHQGSDYKYIKRKRERKKQMKQKRNIRGKKVERYEMKEREC